MPWPKGTNSQDELRRALRKLCTDAGLRCILEGQREPTVPHIVIGGARQEGAASVQPADAGKKYRFQMWRVEGMVVSDEKRAARRSTDKPTPDSVLSGAFQLLFDDDQRATRNTLGIYNAQLLPEGEQEHETRYSIPFTVLCSTGIYLD